MISFQPTATDDMVFSDTDTKRLLKDIISGNLSFPSNGKSTLLLFGSYGSGKTTYANIFFFRIITKGPWRTHATRLKETRKQLLQTVENP